jgi:hypothetical protein
MSELSQRLGAAAERAATAILAAHVHLSQGAAARLARRIFPQRTVELYCEAHRIDAGDAEWIHSTLARTGVQSSMRDHAAEERRLRAGILRFHDWMRLYLPPHRDPVLRELVRLEFAHSLSCVSRLHARHAAHFAAVAAPAHSLPVAVAMYLDRLNVDARLHQTVQALALQRVPAQSRSAAPPPAQARARWLPRRVSAEG